MPYTLNLFSTRWEIPTRRATNCGTARPTTRSPSIIGRSSRGRRSYLRNAGKSALRRVAGWHGQARSIGVTQFGRARAAGAAMCSRTPPRAGDGWRVAWSSRRVHHARERMCPESGLAMRKPSAPRPGVFLSFPPHRTSHGTPDRATRSGYAACGSPACPFATAACRLCYSQCRKSLPDALFGGPAHEMP